MVVFWRSAGAVSPVRVLRVDRGTPGARGARGGKGAARGATTRKGQHCCRPFHTSLIAASAATFQVSKAEQPHPPKQGDRGRLRRADRERQVVELCLRNLGDVDPEYLCPTRTAFLGPPVKFGLAVRNVSVVTS